MNIQQTIERMKETANELKSLFPADATRFDGSTYHSGIDEMVSGHVDYVQQPLANVKAVNGRFDADADTYRRLAAKWTKKQSQ